ncbi:PilZ domain-containing protein [Myxococcota bacterium]|nr:PilZ domain-containing protein [Myxococcota bacterium]
MAVGSRACATADEALSLLARSRPSVAMVDLSVPGPDRWRVLAALRGATGVPRTSVVLISRDLQDARAARQILPDPSVPLHGPEQALPALLKAWHERDRRPVASAPVPVPSPLRGTQNPSRPPALHATPPPRPKPPGREQRRFPRLPADAPATLMQGAEAWKARVADVSEGGLGLVLDARSAPRGRVGLVVHGGDGEAPPIARLVAEVRWARETSGARDRVRIGLGDPLVAGAAIEGGMRGLVRTIERMAAPPSRPDDPGEPL